VAGHLRSVSANCLLFTARLTFPLVFVISDYSW